MYRKKIAVMLLAVVCSFLASGCGPNREEMEKKILAYDPAFQKILDQRNVLQRELDMQRAEYIDKRQKVEHQIALLREKNNKLRAEYMDYFEKMKRQIYPAKRDFEDSQRNVHDLMRPKQLELKTIDKEMRDVQALMDKKEKLSLTEEENQAWGKKMTALVERKNEVEKELSKLKEEAEMLKMKARVMEVR